MVLSPRVSTSTRSIYYDTYPYCRFCPCFDCGHGDCTDSASCHRRRCNYADRHRRCRSDNHDDHNSGCCNHNWCCNHNRWPVYGGRGHHGRCSHSGRCRRCCCCSRGIRWQWHGNHNWFRQLSQNVPSHRDRMLEKKRPLLISARGFFRFSQAQGVRGALGLKEQA